MPNLSHAERGFWQRLADRGEAAALVGTEGQVVTYAALAARAAAWSERLGSTRRLVVLQVDHDVDRISAYLGALVGGHPVAIVGSDHAAASLVATYDPDVVIGPAADGTTTCTVRRSGSRHRLHPDLAVLLSTSGSTGSPKLVRLSHRNLAANAAAIAQYLALTPADRAQTTLPLHYCYGLSVLHSHLTVGGSVVLNDASVVDPCFWRRFSRTRATNFAGVPFTFELLDRVGFPTMDLPDLRFVTQAGGRLAPDVVRRYAALGAERGWQVFVMYGQTEATARMAYLPPEAAQHEPASIGRPIPGGTFEIADPDAEGIGELVYRGPNVMMGYAQEPADLARGATVDVLRTGDLARRTPTGLYQVVGRSARFVKIVGLRVDLDRIEGVLADAGIDAACTGSDDRLVVALTGRHDAADVVRRLLEVVDIPRRAVQVEVVDELPRLASGKIDYRAVLDLAAFAPTAPAREAPTSARLDRVRELYAEVLDVPVGAVRDDDTFVGLGGDSLCYVELAAALEAEFGPLPDGWHVRPVREVETALASGSTSARPTLPTDVLLRALATVVVLGTHVRLFHVQGGAHVLLAVSGLNFARFVVDGAGSPFARMLSTARRIAVPTMCCVLALLVLDPVSFGVWKLLLVHNYADGSRWRYWYIEALLMLCLVLAAVLAVPAVRRLERARPFTVAMAAVGIGVGIRCAVLVGALPGAVLCPHDVLWLFAVGWAATRARSVRDRVLVTAALGVGMVGFFPGDPSRSSFVLAGVLVLVWTVRLPVPRALHQPVTAVAAASLYIYLVQFEVYPLLLRVLPPIAVVPLTLVIGIGVARVLAGAYPLGAIPPRRARKSRSVYPVTTAGPVAEARAVAERWRPNMGASSPK